MKVSKILTGFAFFTLILFAGNVFAQNSANKEAGEISISYSTFGENDLIRFQQLLGPASYNGKGFYSLALNYAHPVKSWLKIETGIRYSKHTLSANPIVPPISRVQHSEEIAMINLPVVLKAQFLDYIFVNGGLSLDLDISGQNSMDEQIGFGGILGLGAQYQIVKGVSIFLNPYAKIHSLLPLQADKHHQRLAETGIRFGFSYNLNALK